MTARSVATRAADLGRFHAMSGMGGSDPFLLLDLVHVYIKLDFKNQYENARTPEDARGFLRSVARAAMAANSLAEECGGALLEVQGSMLHVGVPIGPRMQLGEESNGPLGFCGALHQIYEAVFSDRNSRVDGWRMTADAGRTLVVVGKGIHEDQSWVSLGNSANRPAKQLYAQLELPEDRRQLKRFWVGVRTQQAHQWHYRPLSECPAAIAKVNVLAEDARTLEPQVRFRSSLAEVPRGLGRMAPVGPAGSPASPSPDRPMAQFGWVMRADLDGFAARVEECGGDERALKSLAEGFYHLMDLAAEFSTRHSQELVQLPWAGDNFTAVVVFESKAEYNRALPRRLVETSLDFEKEMTGPARSAGFGGWAYGVAGGEVAGTTAGNVYLAGVEIRGRRFLVGAGEGVGRSAQAFSDVNPKASHIALYTPDHARLSDSYRPHFKLARNSQGQESSLYLVAGVPSLVAARAGLGAAGSATAVRASPSATRLVETRPYCE